MRERVSRILLSVARHATACCITVVASTLSATLAYLALLLIAIIGNYGLGSPALIVIVPVVSFASSLVLSILFLMPVTAAAERLFPSPSIRNVLLQVPFTVIMLFMLCWITFVSIGWGTRLAYAGAATLVLALPMGVYWWTLKGYDAGLWFFRAVAQKLFSWCDSSS